MAVLSLPIAILLLSFEGLPTEKDPGETGLYIFAWEAPEGRNGSGSGIGYDLAEELEGLDEPPGVGGKRRRPVGDVADMGEVL